MCERGWHATKKPGLLWLHGVHLTSWGHQDASVYCTPDKHENIDCVERAECNIRRCRTVSTYARCWELQSTKELFHYRKKKSCGVSLRLKGCFLWLSVSSELKRPLTIFKAVLNTHDKFLTWQQRCYVSFLYMEKVHVWTKARTEAWILVHNLNNINGVMIQCWGHGGNKDRRSWHWEVVIFNVWTLRWP